MRELKEASARISKGKQAANREAQRLRDQITGKTHTITTPGFTLDFGFRAIQEVFPKDELWIAVYDDDRVRVSHGSCSCSSPDFVQAASASG